MSTVVWIGVDEWASGAADLLAFDRRVHAAEDRLGAPVAVRARVSKLPPPVTAVAARQIFLRYQRCSPATNAASKGKGFARALDRHGALHDRRKPLIRADYEHALDTWQWMLRLRPDAGAALQLAALFHDAARLESRKTARQPEDDPGARGRAGAALMANALEGVVERAVLARAIELVSAVHERPAGDDERRLLDDADALSFFGINSWSLVAHRGEAYGWKMAVSAVAKMSVEAKRWLPMLRHPPQLEGWVSP